MTNHTNKRRALARLRELYSEARDLVSGELPCANLEWILGAKSNPRQRPADLDSKTVEVVTLWLQDLAFEVDRGLPSRPKDRLNQDLQSAYRARQSMATRLRVATEGFVTAFRHRVINGDALQKLPVGTPTD